MTPGKLWNFQTAWVVFGLQGAAYLERRYTRGTPLQPPRHPGQSLWRPQPLPGFSVDHLRVEQHNKEGGADTRGSHTQNKVRGAPTPPGAWHPELRGGKVQGPRFQTQTLNETSVQTQTLNETTPCEGQRCKKHVAFS